MRRWAIVAGVWAVAATALAVIALLKPAESNDTETAAAANRSINRLQDRLDDRFEQLEERVDRLPQSADLQKLEDRVTGVEDDVEQAADDAKAARDSIGKLQDRVEKVEQAQDDQDSSSGGGSGDSTDAELLRRQPPELERAPLGALSTLVSWTYRLRSLGSLCDPGRRDDSRPSRPTVSRADSAGRGPAPV